MDRQVRALRTVPEIVVATPGRLLDHVRQGTIDLASVEILVLDEADRMLDMGFIHDIKQILQSCPTERQSLLFSATFTPQHPTARRGSAARSGVDRRGTAQRHRGTPIRQVVHPVDSGRSATCSRTCSQQASPSRCSSSPAPSAAPTGSPSSSKRTASAAVAIHGNKSQSQRVKALTAFKKGQSQVLVATDVAARGLDIEALPHVVNYELPSVPEDYVHRIGRTGRAGLEGTATSLVGVEEQDLMRAIESLLKKPIDREVVDGFEPSFTLRTAPAPGSQPKRSGNRKKKSWNPQYAQGRVGGRPAARRTAKRGNGGQRPEATHGSGVRLESMPGERLNRRPGH